MAEVCAKRQLERGVSYLVKSLQTQCSDWSSDNVEAFLLAYVERRLLLAIFFPASVSHATHCICSVLVCVQQPSSSLEISICTNLT